MKYLTGGAAMRSAMRIMLLLAVACCPLTVTAAPQTIHIPVTLDPSFVRSEFVRQAFNLPGEKALPLNLNEGCSRIELWDPEVGTEKSFLKLGSAIKVQAGLPLKNVCIPLAGWEGNIDLLQQLVFDQKTNRLGLQVMDFKTLGPGGKQTGLDKSLVSLIQSYLNPYLGKVSFDMSGAVKGLQNLLPLFVKDQDRQSFGSWLGTLRVGGVQMKEGAVILDVLMDVDAPAPTGEREGASLPATGIQALVKAWEDWDAFFVNQIQALIGQSVTEDEKGTLLEALLDRRYEFVNSLEEGTITQDLVARQFTETWQTLGSIFRKYLSTKLSGSPADYLSFIATADAIVSLSKSGANVMPDINRSGLLQLAKLIGVKEAEPALSYSLAVNNPLRNFFGFEDLPDDKGPAYEGLEMDFPEEDIQGGMPAILRVLLPFHAPMAHAQAQQSGIDEMKLWVLPKGNIDPYLSRVRMVLDQAAENVLKKKKLGAAYHDLYRSAVLATAWQESCWRQFVVKSGKIGPITSYNQSSVGMMQINEKVWRGIYKVENLRWNIRYNAMTGCEILELYLRQYALKKPESKGLDSNTLARSLYAMYNGGPGQFKKFLARKASNKFIKIDQLFWEKYSLTTSNRIDKISVCLIGR
jgi:hypothetical protein